MYGQDLTTLKRAPAPVRRIIEKGRLVHDGDGAFSRVYAIDSRTVLKVTTCQATIELFRQLIRQPVADCVRVLRAYGKVAVDEDGMKYYGFVVERLYHQKEWQSLPSVSVEKKRKHSSAFCEEDGKLHRVASNKRLRGQVAKHARKRSKNDQKRKSGLTLEKTVMRIRRTIKKNLTLDGRQKGNTLFSQLKRQLGSVTAALEFLNKFVSHRNAELDLLIRGNIMLTRDGKICFSDPVTEMFDNTLSVDDDDPYFDLRDEVILLE